MFYKKGVLRNFAKCCRNFAETFLIIFNSFLKKMFWHRCFPVKFAKFLRTPPVAASSCNLIVSRLLWISDNLILKLHQKKKQLP